MRSKYIVVFQIEHSFDFVQARKIWFYACFPLKFLQVNKKHKNFSEEKNSGRIWLN